MDAVIVNYNTREHLRACTASVLAEADQVIVVDNASTDGSAAMVREEYPQVVLIENSSNVGYGAAANTGVTRSTAKYVMVLNSDTRVLPGTLAQLRSYLDAHTRAAIVGPPLIHPSGHLQPSCKPFPGLVATLLEESALWPLLGCVPVVRELYPSTASHTRPRRVSWVIGAALAIRRGAFDAVGGFDPAFFMYFEEVDLCYRLAAAGWEVHFAPSGGVVHVGGASAHQQRADMAVQALASRLAFYRRHYSRASQTTLVPLIDLIVLARWLLGPIRMRLSRDASRRAALREEEVAWGRVLRGEWLRRAN